MITDAWNCITREVFEMANELDIEQPTTDIDPSSVFTPEQISAILELAFSTCGHKQYIGSRYVPIFGRKGEESIEWDNSSPYEPLTVVLNQGNSYTSRQYVPAGVDITNQTYWANTGNYNAQIEQYRQEVQNLQDDVQNNTSDISEVKEDVQTNTTDIGQLKTSIKELETNVQTNTTDISEVKESVQTNTTAIEQIETNVQTNTNDISEIKANMSFARKKALFIGDSWGDAESEHFTNPYPELVAKSLMMDHVNLCNPSAGFIKTGTTYSGNFQQYFDNWCSQNGNELASISYVIIMGGLNDYNNQRETIITAIINLLNDVMQKLPNAFIYLIPQIASPNMVRAATNTVDGENLWARTARVAISAYSRMQPSERLTCLDDLIYCMQFGNVSTLMDSDMVHPTQYGANYIARQITRALLGQTVKSFILRYSDSIISGMTPSGNTNDLNVVFEGTKLTYTASVTGNLTSTTENPAINVNSFVPLDSTFEKNGDTIGQGFVYNYTHTETRFAYSQILISDSDMTSPSNFGKLQFNPAGGFGSGQNNDSMLFVVTGNADFGYSEDVPTEAS